MKLLRPGRSYADRIELLGLVAERHPYPPGVPDQRAGILLQTKWQNRSGRAIADGEGRLATWWPTANWTLTVWQLEALQSRGEFADVALDERPLALPDDVARAILAYYDRLAEARDGAGERAAVEDELQRLMWAFHVRAIDFGIAASERYRAALGEGEARFVEAWGGAFVGLLAAVNFPTAFDTVRPLQALLPPRLVRAADFDSSTESDLSPPQRGTLQAMRALYESERATSGALAKKSAAASSTPASARAAANHLLESLAFGGRDAAAFLDARLDGKTR